MSNLSELKYETTLSDIAINPDMKVQRNIFAVIVDVSEPKKSDSSSNFLVRLKVIDPSFNYKEGNKNKSGNASQNFSNKLSFHKNVHIFMNAENLNELPKISNVGEIIRLRRFSFSISEKGDLVGRELKFSNWLIYKPIGDNKFSQISWKNIKNNNNRPLLDYELTRLCDLQHWINDFFSNNSLMYIVWWTDLPKSADTCGKKKFEKVDLILRCDDFINKDGKLLLSDKDGHQYELVIGVRSGIKPGEFIKLRCVDVTLPKKDGHRIVKLTNHTACIKIPSHFCDPRLFSNDKKSSKKDQNKDLPFLNDYVNTDEFKGSKKSKYISTIKKSSQKYTTITVDELNKIINNPTLHQGKRYLVNGYIAGFHSTSPSSVIKKMILDTKEVLDLKSKTDKKDKKTKIIYNLILKLKDSSVDKNDTFVNAYLVTDEYGSQAFSSFKILPSVDDSEGWKNIKEAKLAEFEKKLKSMIGADKKSMVAVEISSTKTGKAFAKVIETVFLN